MSLIDELRERLADAQDRMLGLDAEIEKLTGLRVVVAVRVREVEWLIARIEAEPAEIGAVTQAVPEPANGAAAEGSQGRRNIRGEVERAIVQAGRTGISSAELALKLDARPAGVQLATVYLSDPKRRRIVERQGLWYEPGSAPVHMETVETHQHRQPTTEQQTTAPAQQDDPETHRAPPDGDDQRESTVAGGRSALFG